jgi:copper chaperone
MNPRWNMTRDLTGSTELYTLEGYLVCNAEANGEEPKGAKMQERVYNVPDVNCEHCVNAITGELTQIDGVQNVQVDLENKKVTVVASENVSEQQIRDGIDEAGFDIAE